MRKIRRQLKRMIVLMESLEVKDVATKKGKILILALYNLLLSVNKNFRNLKGHEGKHSAFLVNNLEVK